MGFNFTAKFGADGSGYFRELGKVESAAAKLSATGEKQAKVAADATKEKIALEQKLGNLKRGESNLAPRVQATAAVGQEAKARAAGSAMATAQLDRERAAKADLEKEAERAATKRLSSEAALSKVQSRVDAKTEAGSPVPVKLEEQLSAAKARVTLATQAQAAAEAARDKQAAERAGRLAQLERRAATLAAAAAATKAGSEEHDRLTNALGRVQGQATKTAAEIERLDRIAKAAGRNSASAMGAAAETGRRATVAAGLKHGAAKASGAGAGGEAKAIAGDAGGAILSSFGVPLGAAAAAGAAIGAIKSALAFADQLSDSAEQMGVTTSEFQRLEIAAGRAGVGIGDFQTALSQIDVARREAGEGNEELQAQFKRFGVTLDDIQNPALRHLDILKKIAAQSGNTDAAGRAAMKQLLGRRGDRLGGALAEMGQVGENEIVSDASVARLDELNKKVEMVGHSLKTWGVEALAFWDNVFEGAAKLAAAPINPGTFTETVRLTRQERAARDARHDENAGVAQEKRKGDSKIYGEFVAAQVADMQQGGTGKLDFEKFAAARAKSNEEALFTNKTNKKLEEDIAEIIAKRAEIGLTAAQKEKKLKEDIAAIEAESEIAKMAGDDTAALRLQKQAEEKKNALAEVEAKPVEQEKGGPRFESKANSDSLSRIGLFVGGAPVGLKVQPLTGAEHRQELRNVVKALQDANTRELAELRRLQTTTKETLG